MTVDHISSVQLLSQAQLLAIPWTVARQAPPGIVHHQLPELAQTQIHWVGDVIQPSHPLLSSSLPSLNLSQHQSLFKWVISLHQVVKVLELSSFSISPSNKYSGLIFFRIDWFDLFAVQETLKRLLQYRSAQASILWPSAFYGWSHGCIHFVKTLWAVYYDLCCYMSYVITQ